METKRNHSRNGRPPASSTNGTPRKRTHATARPASPNNVWISLSKAQARKSPLPVIITLIALVLLGVAAASVTSSLLNQPVQTTTAKTSTKTPYVSPYDFSGLVFDVDGRPTYSESGVLKSQLGVDVSEYQGEIDWDAVAADGISFAMVRLGSRGYTEGILRTDSYYEYNLDGAAAAGLQVGAYYYSQATSVAEAIEEADLVIELLDGRALDLPIAFDHEQNPDPASRSNTVDSETLTQAALAFCQRIEAAGYKSMIYGNASDISRFNLDEMGGRLVWYAEYGSAQPNGQFDFCLWQYDSEGIVDGIDAAVDMNLRFTDAL